MPSVLSMLVVLALLPLGGCSNRSSACTVSDHEDGTATISCPDGSEATISSGQDGQDGQDGRDGLDGQDGADGHAIGSVLHGNYYVYNTLDIAHLQGVERITGFLWIGVPTLTSLPALDLREVGGHLYVDSSYDHLDVQGLSGLHTVGGNLNISVNHVLEDITGFTNLTSVGEALHVTNNGSLCKSQIDELVDILHSHGWDGYVNISGNNDDC